MSWEPNIAVDPNNPMIVAVAGQAFDATACGAAPGPAAAPSRQQSAQAFLPADA